MKKFVKFFGLLLIVLMFTSCVDYVQSLSYKDGKYQVYYKVTLSKVLLALAQQDPDDFLSELYDDDAFNGAPDWAVVKPVDTDLEVGMEISFQIDPKNVTDEEKQFLPKRSNSKYYIPYLLGKSESVSESRSSGSSEADGMAQAILSSAKCRVLISKKLIPSIKSAYFTGIDKSDYEIPFYDYGESFCIEIPFIVMLENGYRTDRIVLLSE